MTECLNPATLLMLLIGMAASAIAMSVSIFLVRLAVQLIKKWLSGRNKKGTVMYRA